MRKEIILALLMIATCSASTVTWQNQSCDSANTLRTTTYGDDGISNVTTAYTLTPCVYGCDIKTNTCFNPTADSGFLFPMIIALGILGGLSLVMVKITDAEKTWMKLLFLFVSLFSQFYLIGLSASFGEAYVGTASATAKGVLSFSWVYAGLILFITAMFIFQLIIGALQAYKHED